MANLRQLIFDAQRACAQTLLVDLDVGITFVEIAETTRNSATVQRNLNNALAAYRSSVQFLTRLTLTVPEDTAIKEKLIRLKTRLERNGMRF